MTGGPYMVFDSQSGNAVTFLDTVDEVIDFVDNDIVDWQDDVYIFYKDEDPVKYDEWKRMVHEARVSKLPDS